MTRGVGRPGALLRGEGAIHLWFQNLGLHPSEDAVSSGMSKASLTNGHKALMLWTNLGEETGQGNLP